MRILGLHLNHLLEYAEQRGLERNELLESTETSPSVLTQENYTIDVSDYYSVLTLISKKLKDDLLGHRLGNFMSLKSLGLVYQISLQATTIEEALFYLKDYVDATFPIINIYTQVDSQWATIVLEIDNDKETLNRLILENIQTIISRELQAMVGKELHLQFYSPFCNSSYPADWQLGKTFALTFHNTVLKSVWKDRSKWQLDLLVPEYLKLIESIKSEQTFTSKVKIAILSMAKPDLPDLETVSDHFNLTSRTLQRRLVTESTSFREISLELKRKISILLIGHNRFSVTEISDILGFSEPASFIHSFKKWYGNTPEKFRHQQIR